MQYPHERSLVEQLKDAPFALIGVNSDPHREAIQKAVKEKQITWRSFWDPMDEKEGGLGPISLKWNVHSWPTRFVIDHKGIIHGPKMGQSLDEQIQELLAEAGCEIEVTAADNPIEIPGDVNVPGSSKD